MTKKKSTKNSSHRKQISGRPKESSVNYVDNDKFYKLMVDWKAKVKEAESVGDPRPPITHDIGVNIMLICERLSQKHCFNKPYREELVLDAIENCVRYAHNFDADKYFKPFAYFTQIACFAFFRRCGIEKEEAYVKFRSLQNCAVDSKVPKWLRDEIYKTDLTEIQKDLDLSDKDMKNIETVSTKPTLKAPKSGPLSEILEDE